MVFIAETIRDFLVTIADSRSPHTAKAYGLALRAYEKCLSSIGISPKDGVQGVTADTLDCFIRCLNKLAPSTQQVYLSAVMAYFEYLNYSCRVGIDLGHARGLIKRRTKRQGQRLPIFPRDAIEHLIEVIVSLDANQAETPYRRLIFLRDKAFILTLADTGLRVHEACELKVGQIDWAQKQAVIIGKGDKQDIIRFSSRSLTSVHDYLVFRKILDPETPVFARHDKRAGGSMPPMSPKAGREIIKNWSKQAIHDGDITPHSFRHFFVTRVLANTGDLKLAQHLARHTSMQTTLLYVHLTNKELDRGFTLAIEGSQSGGEPTEPSLS